MCFSCGRNNSLRKGLEIKPCNFPDRKNKRRMVALSHLSVPAYKKVRDADGTQGSSEKEEIALQSRINPHGLRNVRTKIKRGLATHA